MKHIPVSYTHLDVYKRQVWNLKKPVLVVKNLIYDVIIGTDTIKKINAIIDFKNNKLICTAVSYTHLDVYKRQLNCYDH